MYKSKQVSTVTLRHDWPGSTQVPKSRQRPNFKRSLYQRLQSLSCTAATKTLRLRSTSRQPQVLVSCLNSLGVAVSMLPADWPFLAGSDGCLGTRLLRSMMLFLQADWQPDLASCHRPLPDSILTSSAPSYLIPRPFAKARYVHRACFQLGSIPVMTKGISTATALRAGMSHAGMHE